MSALWLELFFAENGLSPPSASELRASNCEPALKAMITAGSRKVVSQKDRLPIVTLISCLIMIQMFRIRFHLFRFHTNGTQHRAEVEPLSVAQHP